MATPARPSIAWEAGRRYIVAFLAGAVIGSILVQWKLSGFDSSEYFVFWIIVAAIPPTVWTIAHIDRIFLRRKTGRLSVTFTALGLLSGVPMFLAVYVFRLYFRIRH